MISPCATGTAWPVTLADTATPPAAVTVQASVDGRCISLPWRTVYRDSPSPGSSPVATRYTPSPSAAEPVAGSSGTPIPGQNTRACAVRLSGSHANALTAATPVVGSGAALARAAERTG